MLFYRATYTSYGGKVADFVFCIDEGAKTMSDLVIAAFRQLNNLHISTIENPNVDNIAINVEFEGDIGRKYFISPEMPIPSNVFHLYFSHLDNTSFVSTGESSKKSSIKRSIELIESNASSKIVKIDESLKTVTPIDSQPKINENETAKESSIHLPIVLDYQIPESLSPVQQPKTNSPFISDSGSEEEQIKIETPKIITEESKPEEPELKPYASFYDSSDSESSESEESSEHQSQSQPEKKLIETGDKSLQKKEFHFTDTSDSSSESESSSESSQDEENASKPTETGKSQSITKESSSESSSSESSSSESSSSESEDEDETTTAPAVSKKSAFSALIKSASAKLPTSEPSTPRTPTKTVSTRNGPQRSFKNIYKDGNKKEEIDVPTPTLPEATDASKVYKRHKRSTSKK